MPEQVTTAVIAAAGRGTRMWPASKVCPKELFPLGKVPVIMRIVWELLDAGISNVVIVAGKHNRDLLCDLFDPSTPAPVNQRRDPLATRFENSLRTGRISIIEQAGDYGNGTPLRLAAE
jgi:UTP-glucose-1-phosphate uridylyltransferase